MLSMGHPRCSKHSRLCSLRVVRKDGENKGRQFYCCPLPRNTRCDYFQVCIRVQDLLLYVSSCSLLGPVTCQSWTHILHLKFDINTLAHWIETKSIIIAMNLTVLVTSLTVEKVPACANALILSDVKQMRKRNTGLWGPLQVVQISFFLKERL